MTETELILIEPAGALNRYERALYWLAEAVRVDEVMQIRDEAEQLKLLGKQCKDKTLQANAVELQMRAERKLGEVLIAAKEAGQIGRGAGFHGRNAKGSDGEHLNASGSGQGQAEFHPGAGPGQPRLAPVRLEDVGIDRKLSMKAQALAKSPIAIFEDVVRQSREKVLAGKAIVINPIRDVGKREKQVRRAIKEAQLAQRQKALPTKLYGVIYADPEWRFETYSDAGLDRAPDYPTSTTAVIKARVPVGTLAAPDSVLFLWATVPMLEDALEVMRFWGFTYKTHFAWDKIEPGTGFWNRNQHELLLVGTRGNVPAPAMGTQYPSLMTERKSPVHSEKPEWAYEMIEAYFPNLPRIELNARKARPGWSSWGNEAPDDDEVHPAVGTTGGAAAGEAATLAVSPAPDHDRGASLYAYRMALANVLDRRGQLDRGAAEPVLRAAYTCDPIVPPKQIADDIGHKHNTVLSWAHRLGLSDISRRADNQFKPAAAQLQSRQEAI